MLSPTMARVRVPESSYGGDTSGEEQSHWAVTWVRNIFVTPLRFLGSSNVPVSITLKKKNKNRHSEFFWMKLIRKQGLGEVCRKSRMVLFISVDQHKRSRIISRVGQSESISYPPNVKSLPLGDIDISPGNREPTMLVDGPLGNVRTYEIHGKWISMNEWNSDNEIHGKAYNWHGVLHGLSN